MTQNSPSPFFVDPKPIPLLLAEVLEVPAGSADEAVSRLRQLIPSAEPRTREVIDYVLSSVGAVSFLDRRGGGTSLRYILWWLFTHGRENYEPAAKVALSAALKSGWPLQNAYSRLVHIAEVQPYLPPASSQKAEERASGGVHFLTRDGLTIAVNCQENALTETDQENKMFTFSMKEGAHVYLGATSKGGELRLAGRTGLRFPDPLPFGWIAAERHERTGLPIRFRMMRKPTDQEIEDLIQLLWDQMDRRWNQPDIPAALGGDLTRQKG